MRHMGRRTTSAPIHRKTKIDRTFEPFALKLFRRPSRHDHALALQQSVSTSSGVL